MNRELERKRMSKNSFSPIARDTMAYILAGGRGSRLLELTDWRAKPAVPFGGKSRVIDFTLSNALNSGIKRIGVATQYKAHSLIRHMQRGWNFMRPERNESFDILPASQRLSSDAWYAGTADAVYQNLDIIQSYRPKYIVILAGDHIYKMDYELMLQQHVDCGSDVTIACLEVNIKDASQFGILEIDENDCIKSFVEKPQNPVPSLGKKDTCLASMGIYVFNLDFLVEQLHRDVSDPNSSRDFGKDIIPYIVKNCSAVAHRFTQSCVRSEFEPEAYWRDIGTLDAYWESNIDLTDTLPALDLYDQNWPIWTYSEVTPPAKFVHNEDGRRGQAASSLISGGCIVSGASLSRSLLFTGVRIHSYSSVDQAVILPNVEIGRNARLKNVIIDSGIKIPEGLIVGEDPILDAQRFRRTEKGICLITKTMIDALR
jgi:glucose-1-phosphate adenylyltransferase